jgi:hypothetical protein
MATIELFVGSNNETGRVDREALERVLTRFVDGYTIRDAKGYWEGTREDSVSVLLDIDDGRRNALFDGIMRESQQRAIAWHDVSPLRIVAAA